MDAITQYLDRQNCTQTEFAAKLGVSHSTVSRIISGERKPSAGLTRRIEALTGIHRHILRPDVYEAAQ